MKKTTRLKIGAALVLIGFVIVIGSAGAFETGSIGFRQASIQMIAGIILVFAGGFGGGLFR